MYDTRQVSLSFGNGLLILYMTMKKALFIRVGVNDFLQVE